MKTWSDFIKIFIVMLVWILLAHPATASEYVVKRGDNLWSIAKKFYNDPNRWRDIYEANRHLIMKKGALKLGWVLTIPEVSENKIMLVTGNEYAPFTDEKCPEDGMITEMAALIFKEMGYDPIIKFRDWKDGYQATKKGKFTATFPYVKEPDRLKDFYFSDPVHTILTRCFVRKDSSVEYAEAEDLKGLSCCKPEGYNLDDVQEFLDKGLITLKRPKDMQTCFTMLKDKKVDIVPINELVGWSVVQGLFKTKEDFRTLDKSLGDSTLHLIISKTYPNGKSLIEKFNQNLDKLSQEGVLQEVSRRHLQYYYSKGM
ncbi:transporter substrate-binding domain-containing protein [Desulfonema magnum]|uniref:ABC transporter, solute-binding protein family 3 n=1 Tax=Desulfonema magnum TaxID=45655 RepID=A0A975BJI5_9BACT|nr:transporter substrate-binding domain-containing protein [Desulfonema magnum]QTA86525.1 ABC transporter, solute-binding protein family 3 [Desulfonema magnum]